MSKAKRSKANSVAPKTQLDMLNREDIHSTYLSEILKKSGSMSPKDLWSSSQLEIDDFYEQLKKEEEGGLIKEIRNLSDDARFLEAV